MKIIEAKESALIIAPKRSGTNYTHDILAPAFSCAVNEPLGLHNDTRGGKSNPLDPWSFSSIDDTSDEYGHKKLAEDPFGSLITKSFLYWLKEGDKLIKETDFLHLGWLLASVPLKIMVIHRDPRESIASFKKYGLFQKWGYREKMNQFSHSILDSPQLNTLYGGLTDFDEFANKHYIHQLSIYYAIAFLEISRNTQGQNVHTARYEDLVNQPRESFQQAMSFFGKKWNKSLDDAVEARHSTLRDKGPHGTFRTKNDLTRFTDYLSPYEEGEISAIFNDIGVSLSNERMLFFMNVENDELIQYNHELVAVKNVSRLSEVNQIKNERVKAKSDDSLFISRKLVTNSQYASFLAWLVGHGIPLSVNGKPVFYNDRPQGRIRRHGNTILIESVYADHPVNFINWIGASAYCAWVAGRLPTAVEWEKYICPTELSIFTNKGTINERNANIGQFYSDTTPVTYFAANADGIYDALGNTSIWLRNDSESSSSFEQKKAGLEWNHSPERGIYPNPRPYWLGTSGLGVRPVFTALINKIEDDKFLQDLLEITDFLRSRHKLDVAQTNKELFRKIELL